MDQIHVRLITKDHFNQTGLLGPHDKVDFPDFDRTVVLDETNEEIGINLGEFVVF